MTTEHQHTKINTLSAMDELFEDVRKANERNRLKREALERGRTIEEEMNGPA